MIGYTANIMACKKIEEGLEREELAKGVRVFWNACI